MNSSQVTTVDRYYNFIDSLCQKHLLTKEIATQVKADLYSLNFKNLDFPSIFATKATRQDIDDIQWPLKNLIRNGKFAQWQHGETVEYRGKSIVYFADCWFGRRGRFANNLIASKVNFIKDNNTAMRLSRVEGDENTGRIALAQLIDSEELTNSTRKKIILTAKIRCGREYSATARRLTMSLLGSHHSNIRLLNPFTLGKDSQVITSMNLCLTQNWNKYTIYGYIPPTTRQAMVSFYTEETSPEPARTEDYWEITDVELKVHQI